MANNDECMICAESCNKNSRLKCMCPHCEYIFCRKCLQKYILTCNEYTITCMNCAKGWTHDVLNTFITKNFLNVDLKKHRENVLLEREKSLLPATQPEAHRIASIRKIKADIDTLFKQRREINIKLERLKEDLHILEQGVVTSTQKIKEKCMFIINCPKNNCRGFVNNKSWLCGICQGVVCNKCHEYIDTTDVEHTCNDDNVKSAALLKKDTKACPTCSSLIYKVSGCTQMWCTQCHTAFDWISGVIVNKNIHNPHYYDWMKKNGAGNTARTFGDIPCGGLISLQNLHYILMSTKETPTELRNDVMNIHHIVSHIQNTNYGFMQCMDLYRTNIETNHIDLRIKYLLNEITEEQFKIMLQKNEKKHSKNRDIYHVLELYSDTMVDLFNNIIYDYHHDTLDLNAWVEQVSKFFSFLNIEFKKISHRYSCVVPLVSIKDTHMFSFHKY